MIRNKSAPMTIRIDAKPNPTTSVPLAALALAAVAENRREEPRLTPKRLISQANDGIINSKWRWAPPRRVASLATIFLCLFIASDQHGFAQEQTESTPPTALKRKIREALFAREFDTAAELATSLADQSKNADDKLAAADALLRSGKSKRSVELFDSYIAELPAAKPYLWQRGIALYFIKRYSDGAQQFEVHRKVNPHDVENAAWHYLCIAKAESPTKAKQMLLPAPGDLRPPMKEVLEMFQTGDTQSVMKRIDSLQGTGSEKSANFYGHFYLGLYADASGDTKNAKLHLDKSVKNAPRNYMGDVAYVYAKHLAEGPRGTK